MPWLMLLPDTFSEKILFSVICNFEGNWGGLRMDRLTESELEVHKTTGTVWARKWRLTWVVWSLDRLWISEDNGLGWTIKGRGQDRSGKRTNCKTLADWGKRIGKGQSEEPELVRENFSFAVGMAWKIPESQQCCATWSVRTQITNEEYPLRFLGSSVIFWKTCGNNDLRTELNELRKYWV